METTPIHFHSSFAHLSQDRSQDSALPLNGGHVPSGEESPSCSRSAQTAALNQGGKQRVCVYTNTHKRVNKQGPPSNTGLRCSARPCSTGCNHIFTPRLWLQEGPASHLSEQAAAALPLNSGSWWKHPTEQGNSNNPETAVLKTTRAPDKRGHTYRWRPLNS